MFKRSPLKSAALMALLAVFMISAGCIDAEWKLQIKADGSGKLTQTYSGPQTFLTGPEVLKLDVVASPPAQVSATPGDDGKLTVVRTAEFKSLTDLALAKTLQVKLMRTEEGKLWGLIKPDFKLTATLSGVSGVKEVDPDVAKLLAGHFFKLVIITPYDIAKAHNLKIGAAVIKPAIDAKKKQVTWAIPLATAALLTGEVPCSLELAGEFKLPKGAKGKVQTMLSE